MNEPTNLAEAIQKEIERNRELLEAYKTVGNVGDFARVVIAYAIHKGVNALASGDAVEMVQALADLRETE